LFATGGVVLLWTTKKKVFFHVTFVSKKKKEKRGISFICIRVTLVSTKTAYIPYRKGEKVGG